MHFSHYLVIIDYNNRLTLNFRYSMLVCLVATLEDHDGMMSYLFFFVLYPVQILAENKFFRNV